MDKICLRLNASNFVHKCLDLLPSDLQNLEGCSFVRVQPSYNLYQNVMRFNVPHMRGTLNQIFHERRQKSDPILCPERLFKVANDMISMFSMSYESGLQ